MACLGHARVHREPGAVRGGLQLQLVDVETELVEPLDALGHAVALLVGAEDLLAGQLVPQRVVALRQLAGHLDRVDVGREEAALLQVEQLPTDPFCGVVDVAEALAHRQRRMELGGLGVDQVRGDRARVRAEQCVGQRAIAPVEPGEVQPGEQFDHRVDQLVGGVAGVAVGEDVAVGHRVVEEPGDQDRVLFLPVSGPPLPADPQHGDGGHPHGLQLAQQAVFASGESLADLLEREHHAVDLDEPHDVAGDAAVRHLEQPVVDPVGQRDVPREGQQPRRMLGRGPEDEPHPSSIGSPAGLRRGGRPPRRGPARRRSPRLR